MGAQTLGLGEPDRGGAERAKLVRAEFQDRGALDEIEHRKSRRKTRRPGRRQHMVGAAHIVADHFGRVPADEDRARIGDPVRQIVGVLAGQFQMFGGDAVCTLARHFPVLAERDQLANGVYVQAEIARVADAVVVGSALVEEVAAALAENAAPAPRVLAKVRALGDAVRAARSVETV